MEQRKLSHALIKIDRSLDQDRARFDPTDLVSHHPGAGGAVMSYGEEEHEPLSQNGKFRYIRQSARLITGSRKALDSVRKSLYRETGSKSPLKGQRWSIPGNEWTRSEDQQTQRKELAKTYPKLADPRRKSPAVKATEQQSTRAKPATIGSRLPMR
jgi:hypothetical protein